MALRLLRKTAGGVDVPRPGEYHPKYAEIARAMCKLGATDMDLACEFGVKTQTILNGRCKYPEFLESTLEGKEAFDNRAERSLCEPLADIALAMPVASASATDVQAPSPAIA